MKQILLFLVLILFLPPWLRAQVPEVQITYLTAISDPGNNIVYDVQRPLVMDDFLGRPDAASDAVAITASGFRFQAGYRRSGGKTTLQIGVYCSFNKQESWMKEKGRDPHILAHEQHHFDISYLHTLRFIQKLRLLRFREQGFMEQIREVYDETVSELEAMQKEYDRETSHGIFKEEQLGWSRRISTEVNTLAKKVR
jgi:hypothetical protein